MLKLLVTIYRNNEKMQVDSWYWRKLSVSHNNTRKIDIKNIYEPKVIAKKVIEICLRVCWRASASKNVAAMAGIIFRFLKAKQRFGILYFDIYCPIYTILFYKKFIHNICILKSSIHIWQEDPMGTALTAIEQISTTVTITLVHKEIIPFISK